MCAMVDIRIDEEGRPVVMGACLECGRPIEALVACTRAVPAVCEECNPCYLSVTDHLVIMDLFTD